MTRAEIVELINKVARCCVCAGARYQMEDNLSKAEYEIKQAIPGATVRMEEGPNGTFFPMISNYEEEIGIKAVSSMDKLASRMKG